MGYNNLFSPFKIGNLKLENRIIFPSIVTKLAMNGEVTDKLIDYHLKRVEGGTGLNILESTSVDEGTRQKEYLSIAEDSYIAKLKELVDKVHEKNGKIGIQLWDSGFNGAENLDREVIMPSETRTKEGRRVPEVKTERIKKLIENYKKGAKRAYEAGFDLIELNIGSNTSLHNFLSSEYNQRTDEYGGSLENRAKLLLEIVKGVKKAVEGEIPIAIKIISQDDYLEKGLTNEDIIKVLKLLEEDIDLITVTRGNRTSRAIKYECPTLEIDRDFNLENTIKIKKEINIPVSIIGNVIDPEYAENILKENYVDLVSIGRGQVADPDFSKKSKEGRIEDINTCLLCNEGCYKSIEDILFNPISCLKNPELNLKSGWENIKTENPLKIAVVGGGVGGIVASTLLDKKGHRTVLYERRKELGGQYRLLGKNKLNIGFKKHLEELIEELEAGNTEIKLNKEFQDNFVTDEDYDAVVIATGSSPKTLDIKGNNLEKVIDYEEVFNLEKINYEKVILLGGSSRALELADYLKDNGVKEVLILEEKELGSDLDPIKKTAKIDYLKEKDVKMYSDIEILEITEENIIVKEAGKKHKLKSDLIIMAVGAESNKSNDIKQYCQDREIPFYVLGDALIPRKALEAIKEAYNIAIKEID